MREQWMRLLALVVLSVMASGLGAQTEEFEGGRKKLGASEESRLRAVLAAPVPAGALSANLLRHFSEKEQAAILLGDEVAQEATLRQAAAMSPDPGLRHRLASILSSRGQLEEAITLRRQAVATADGAYAAYLGANLTCDLYLLNKDDEARAAFADAAERIRTLERVVASESTNAYRNYSDTLVRRDNFLLRAASVNFQCLSQLEDRRGRSARAIEAADTAERYGRQALARLPAGYDFLRIATQQRVASGIRRKHLAYRNAGRLQDAERALADALRYAREVLLPANNLAYLYADAGELRFAQREFAPAEQLARKADAILAGLDWHAADPRRTARAHSIFNALAAQKKWPEALRELQRLDDLAGDNARLRAQVRFGFDRAIVYLGNGMASEAAPLFAAAARANATRHGDHHFLAAQATGLQGVALWRAGGPDNKAKALPLLKASVRDIMAPANADFLENIGTRKELREGIFAAYLEALATTPGENAAEAIGAADWVRGGVVQEALGDAAVRSAAGTPALSDVVRREQDARNEVAGLRRFLSQETGPEGAALPAVATQLRERIGVLEAEREKLRAEIKAKFPEYERLVRPTPPTALDIAGQLDANQALLMLLPTPEAVYVWAVAADRPPAFARVAMTDAQVSSVVAQLRSQLDLAQGAVSRNRYDSAAAFELYNKLLAPVAPAWQGKTQLVVAAGGALSQLPFAVLHTRASGGGVDADAPWLIREASIAQVPSLSAWLSIKALAKAKAASQAFVGWGDPTFGAHLVARTAGDSAQVRSIAVTRASALADLERSDAAAAPPAALKYADFPPLPETRDELLAIAGTLNANVERDLLLGARATRDSVLAASRSGLLAERRVVAFATHGLMAGDLPSLNQPALAMAATGVEEQDPLAPLLTLEDVLGLKLNADWVLLSACNTAAADGRADEALSGLARGFFYAGSRSLLVTHWAVESESAKLLTTSTFAHYAANPQEAKAESLRQGMLKVMAMPQFRHPAYWAPYALVGDGGR